MKDEFKHPLTLKEFDDEFAALIDRASDDLTVAELVDSIEMQLFILKMRMTRHWHPEQNPELK